MLALLGSVQAVAQTPPPPLYVQKIPVGAKPMGVAALSINTSYIIPGPAHPVFLIDSVAAVANSGDNSISLFRFGLGTYNRSIVTANPLTTIQNVPSPYGVAGCVIRNDARQIAPILAFFVTSPSNGSVSLVNWYTGNGFIGTIQVGAQPYSVACNGNRAAVSNYGEKSLSIVEFRIVSGSGSSPITITETTRVSNVPGSRAPHGIAITSAASKNLAWVVGTEANVLTVVDLDSAAVVASLPVRSPTSVFCCISGGVAVTSSLDNNIVVFDPSSMQINQTIPNVANAQDISATEYLGTVAILGADRSVSQVGVSGVSGVSGTSGTAALATGNPFPGGSTRPYLLATSPDTNSVFFAQLQPLQGPPTLPLEGEFTNDPVPNAPFAPGSRGTLGAVVTGLTAGLGLSPSLIADSLPLPKTLGGVSLNFGGTIGPDSKLTNWVYNPTGGIDAGLFSANYGNVAYQVPPGIGLGDSVPVQFISADGHTYIYTIRIVAVSPGIHYYYANSRFNPRILNEDSSLNLPTNPAARGSIIQIYANGAGDTTPMLLPGEAAPASGNPLVLTKAQPTVTIGGVAAPVQFSGMAPGFVGLWQINAQIPQDVQPGTAVSVVVSAGGVASNTVTIAVQ